MTEGMDPADYKLHWAQDEQGEIGKRPKDPPNSFWVENIPPPYVQPKGRWDNNGKWK